MKTSENTTTTTSQNHHDSASTPFFSKEGQGSFFSETKESEQPFFQPKLTIGQPNDKYEQEADAVANRVVSGQRSEVSGQTAASDNTAQRTCSTCGKEEEIAQPKLLVPSGELQRKAIFESNEVASDAPQSLQMKPNAAPVIQRKCGDCEAKEKLQKKEEEVSETDLDIEKKAILESQSEPPPDDNLVQQQSENSGNTASPDLQSRLNSSKGGGQSLPSSTQESMGSAMGADFSGVRVHTGSEAVQMNRELGAQAFTHGSDVYFNEGKYDANSSGGERLLAHELVHTVQQGGSRINIQRKIEQKDIAKRAKGIYEAVDGWGTSNNKIFENISGLNQSEAKDLKGTYYKEYGRKREGRNLTSDLDYEFEDDKNTYRAYQLLHHKINQQSSPLSKSNMRIKVSPSQKKVLSGSTINYEMDIGSSIYSTVSYQWYVYNDPESVFKFQIEGIDKPKVVTGPNSRIWKDAKWAFEGKHKVVCMVRFGDNEPSFFEFIQEVEMESANQDENFEEPVFEMTDEELHAMDDGKVVEKIGLVQMESGTNLRSEPNANAKNSLGTLPINTKLFVDRNVGNGWLLVYVEGHQRNSSLPVTIGESGFVAASSINTDLPDPESWLYRITKDGQGALSIAKEVYKDFTPKWGKDYRYLVNVLATVNEAKGKHSLNYIYLSKLSLLTFASKSHPV